jgi:hypothetical protein
MHGELACIVCSELQVHHIAPLFTAPIHETKHKTKQAASKPLCRLETTRPPAHCEFHVQQQNGGAASVFGRWTAGLSPRKDKLDKDVARQCKWQSNTQRMPSSL